MGSVWGSGGHLLGRANPNPKTNLLGRHRERRLGEALGPPGDLVLGGHLGGLGVGVRVRVGVRVGVRVRARARVRVGSGLG